MKNKNKFAGAAAALAANTIFGFSFIFSKMALSAAHPLIILSVRFTVAFIVMSLLALTGKKATEEVVNNIFSRFCVGK